MGIAPFPRDETCSAAVAVEMDELQTRARALVRTTAGDIRKVVVMVAAMATVSGSAASLAALTDVSEDVGGWLRAYDGYRGVFVFADQDEKRSRVITLWETPEDELAARQARGAMRDQLMAIAGLEVVSFDVYEVPGHEYVAD